MDLFKLELPKINESPSLLQGIAVKGEITKQILMKDLSKKIAVINHKNVDEVVAQGLIEAEVKAIINAQSTMDGSFPMKGPLLLLQAGIPIYEINTEIFERIQDGSVIRVDSFGIHQGDMLFPCSTFSMEQWHVQSILAEQNMKETLSDFIDNTLSYAYMEKDFVIHPPKMPKIFTRIAYQHVLIVIRGTGYKQDLQAMKQYIDDFQPVLIGVDGGADALMQNGYKPQIIMGDMDSISDQALLCGAEIIVHAYPDGHAPGLQRVHALGLTAKSLKAPGTSEDIAMLLAYEKDAELIVTLGTHNHMIDFLEKGRKGMASTLLVRMKIGSKLMDAKGISKLYPHRSEKS